MSQRPTNKSLFEPANQGLLSAEQSASTTISTGRPARTVTKPGGDTEGLKGDAEVVKSDVAIEVVEQHPLSRREKKRRNKRKASKKAPLKKGTQPPRITPAKYNEMYQAYREKQSVTYVTKKCRVNYDTADFYINGKGKPEFAMEQIKERYLRAEKAKHTQEDRTDIERARERLRLVDAIINLAGGETMLHQRDLKNRIEDYDKKVIEWQSLPEDTRGEPPPAPRAISLGALGKLLDRMVRTEQYLRGGVDKVLGVVDAGNRFSRYTDEELLQLAYTGRVPDHDRSANNLERRDG